MNRYIPWTIASAGRAFRDGRLSPLLLLELHLQRIRHDEELYHTFIVVMEEEARAQALQAEQELDRGLDRGALHGIPISIKDMIAYAGFPMTNGSGRTPPFLPSTHAHIVDQLLSAGAVIIGKSHLHEFAYGKHNPAYGSTRNPYRLDRLPGGSSSGSAAGVAAEFALGSIGSDSAGSVRVPASFCGVAGFKPTAGRLSLSGITPLAPSLDHAGIIARTCEDAALLFSELDQNPDKVPTQSLTAPPTFGVPLAYLQSPTDPEVRNAILDTVRILEMQGASIHWLHNDLPIQEIKDKTWTILHYEAYNTHNNLLSDWAEGYSEHLRSNLMFGHGITKEEYNRCLAWRDSFFKAKQLFTNVDVIITPTCPVTAGPIHYSSPDRPTNGEFTPSANLWGLPALSLPIGLSKEGMPIGLQITGCSEDDKNVLAAGIYIEQILDEFNLWNLQ